MDSGSIVVTVSGFYSQAMEVVSTHMISIGVIVSGLYVQVMEMIKSLYEDTSDKLRPFYTRISSFVDEIVKGRRKIWPFQSLNGPFAIGSLISFVVAMSCAYLYLFPSSSPVVRSYGITPKQGSSIHKCNVFEGRWIRDESYPLYNASHCPFAERGFNCLANGRKDNGYSKWRWKPTNCEVPRFNVIAVLEKLQGKRVVFVGDSLSRTQWESFICLLMVGVEDKSSVYEVNGNEITKEIRFLGVLFSSFRLRIDFYRSVFLVQPNPAPRHSPKRVKSTLRLDLMDDISKEWIDSDVLIFNSGHWWTKSKLFEMGVYFQVGKSLKLGMPIPSAFKKALGTWSSWADTMINANRTSVFFRTFEASHWSGHKRNSCKVTRHPWNSTRGKDRSSISDIIMKVMRKTKIPVKVLHVTPLGAYRSDGHVGHWSDNPSVADCSHWCLPGVPDMWNEILFSYPLNI